MNVFYNRCNFLVLKRLLVLQLVLLTCLTISLFGTKVFNQAVFLFMIILIVVIGSVMVSFVGSGETTLFFNETTFANCTVNCSYTAYNASFNGLLSPGLSSATLMENLLPSFGDHGRDCEVRSAHVTFVTVFAVLFAGVTGIMSGANVSGELKNPSKSIPNGTFVRLILPYFLIKYFYNFFLICRLDVLLASSFSLRCSF